MKYVIIGGSIAGINCVEGIRSLDSEGGITVLSAEPYSNYGRPLISYYLEGKTDLARMSYRGADFYEKNRVTVLHGVSALGIDPKAKTLALSDGITLPYDKLCVATGSAPFVPKFEGLDTVEKRFAFTTLSDALALEKAVTPESKVLIVGAGFIGLKCAEGLMGRVGSVTVCDLAEHAMSSILDADSAPILERHLERNGIRLLLGDSAARFEGNTAYMQSGEEIPFDILVIAVGVRPNTALLAAAGAEVGRGILVDDHMSTSLPQVWAAGDCVETPDITAGENALLAILPNAAMQGRCSGVNMAGGEAVFDKGIKMNSIGFFGLHIMTAGSYAETLYAKVTETGCKKLFGAAGRLTGFILVGDVARAGVYTSLIREQTPLESVDFAALKKEPSLFAFSKEIRAKKLGGVV